MQTFDQALVQLVKEGLVAEDEARRTSTNPHDFDLALMGVMDRRSSDASEHRSDDLDPLRGDLARRPPRADLHRVPPVPVRDRESEVHGEEERTQRAVLADVMPFVRESWPSMGRAATITKPTVIAVRWNAEHQPRDPARLRSKMIAPSSRGTWNVSSPTTMPMSVFGMVQRNPSHTGIWSRERGGAGKVEGYRDCVMAHDRCRPGREGARRAVRRRRLRAVPGRRRGPRRDARPDVAGHGLRDLGQAPRDHQGAAGLGGQPLPRRRAVRDGRRAQGRRSSSRSRRSARRSTRRSTASPR